MKQGQKGFTMIELIVVIVILGILAATALPKFFDMSSDAQNAAAQGVAGAAGSAMSVNFAACQVQNNVPSANKCVKISSCAQVGTIMQGGLPQYYTAAASGADLQANNTSTATCTVTYAKGAASAVATFTGLSAGN